MDGDAPRLTVGVVGFGRVGSILAVALAEAGHRIGSVAAVSAQSKDRARRLLPGTPIRTPEAVVAASDLVLLTVPDDELAALIAGLASAGAWRSGQIVVHTSGAYGLEVLTPASAYGVLPLALHPAMTFTGRAEDVDRLPGTVFGITAEPDYRAVAETLVMEMRAESVWVPEHARPLYHAALSHAANHIVTLLCDATDLLAGAGVETPTRMLTPLVNAAVDNALRLSDAALTGPVSRGDAATVAAHVRALAREDPAVLPSYAAMARRTAERALAVHRITATAYGHVLAALADTDPLGAVETGALDLSGAWPDAPPESGPAESSRSEPGPPESSSRDSGPSNSGRSDSGRSDSGRSDSGRSDSGRSDSGRSDSGRSDSGRSDSGRSDSGRSDSGRSDSGRSDSGRSESGRSDSARSDSARSDSGRSDSGRSDSGRSDSGRSDSGRSESGPSDSGRSDSGRSESGPSEADAG